jgi:hypothetical protein
MVDDDESVVLFPDIYSQQKEQAQCDLFEFDDMTRRLSINSDFH